MKKLAVVMVSLTLVGCGIAERQLDSEYRQTLKGVVMNDNFSIQNFVKLIPRTVEDIKRAKTVAIQNVNKSLKHVLDLPANERSFDNTPRAVDTIVRQFSFVAYLFSLLQLVEPNDEVRHVATHAVQELTEFSVDTFQSKRVYNAFKQYIEGNRKNETLTAEQEYFLDQEMKDFIRAGLELDDASFAKVQALSKREAKIGQDFGKAIAEDDSHFFVKPEELVGVSQDTIEQLKKGDGGTVRVECDTPTVIEVLAHCKNPGVRRRMSRAFSNRAYPENMKRLSDLINVRDERAGILGFSSFAHLNLDPNMVDGPEQAEKFVTSLIERVEKKEALEFARLGKDLPNDVTLTKKGLLQPWDVSYAREHYKKKHYDVDEREIAQYFPMGSTVQGIFDIYQKFLGVDFEMIKPTGLWHEDVSCIHVKQKETGETKGYILLDLFPRKNKYSHACCSSLLFSLKKGEVVTPSICTVIANFPKPTGSSPSRLKHSDVVTFFHEFGHAMHATLGVSELNALSGLSVKWDFVEMPSQMLEEWMWDKKILKQISSHYKTGEPLPEELIDRMVELKQFASGANAKRQLTLALLSLECFKSGQNKDTQLIRRKLYDAYRQFTEFDDESRFQASFGHLDGYGAQYYGYMWSKVFALDLFDRIKEHGLLDEEIGQQFVEKVLGRGGSTHPNELLVDFLGREPNQEAFLKDLGL